MIQFAEFAPDRADTDPAASDAIRNCLAQAKSYGPFLSFSAYSAALAERARGGILARTAAGSYTIYAGTSDSLYQTSTTAWADRSKSAAVYSVGANASWAWLQFGSKILATNVADPVQVVDVDVGGNFADLGGSPPQAAYIGRAAGFVVLGGITGFPRRVQWSAQENQAGWTPGTDLSDFQDLPIAGVVTGIVGDETGAFIGTTSGFYRMQFLPGSRAVFSFTEITPASGKGDEATSLIAPFSMVPFGRRVFYVSENGFAELGTPTNHIGAERVDEYFLNDIDLDYLEKVQGVADPVSKNIFWRYRSGSASGGAETTDKVLAYSVTLNRWSYIEVNLQSLMTATTPGYTMDALETTLGYATVDAIPSVLDSRIWKGGRPGLAAFDTDNKLGFFSGSNMEAVIETADVLVGGEGRRAFVSGFRPVVDAEGLYGQIGGKATHGEARTWTAEAAQVASNGLIPGRKDARLHRFRVRIPSGTVWNHAVGVEDPPSGPAGMR